MIMRVLRRVMGFMGLRSRLLRIWTSCSKRSPLTMGDIMERPAKFRMFSEVFFRVWLLFLGVRRLFLLLLLL